MAWFTMFFWAECVAGHRKGGHRDRLPGLGVAQVKTPDTV